MKKAWVINLEERPDRSEQFYTNEFPFGVKRFEAIPHEQGWVGCAQSHFEVLSQLTQFPAVVFEDDAQLIRPWSVVEEAMKELPKDWDLLQLGVSQFVKETEPYSNNLHRLYHGQTTHAIVYGSQCVVNAILKGWDNYVKNINTHPKAVIDLYYSEVIYPMFNCFIVVPTVATQRPGFSDIERTHKDYRKWI